MDPRAAHRALVLRVKAAQPHAAPQDAAYLQQDHTLLLPHIPPAVVPLKPPLPAANYMSSGDCLQGCHTQHSPLQHPVRLRIWVRLAMQDRKDLC